MTVRAVAAGLILFAAWEYWRQSQEGEPGGVVGAAWDDLNAAAGAVVDYAEGSIVKLSEMKRVTPDHVRHPNVQAFLRVIRTGEGTADEAGYRRHYGGALFSSFADHPRKVITKGRWSSSAAGAYQFLTGTWDETRRIMGLPDFSPASQDLGAVGRIAARRALDDVLAGRFETAVRKCALEWASLPGSPYGQPVISWERARAIYASAGGVDVGVMA